MSGVLLGTQATAGLSSAALGLTFCPIPEGPYPIGGAGIANNPPRNVQLDAFDMADATLTNSGLAAGLRALDGRDTFLMVETVPDRRFDIVARGTKAEVAGLEMSRLQDALVEMGILRAIDRVGDVAKKGANTVFDLFGTAPPSRIHLVTLEHHKLEGLDDGNQPALMSFNEASALAAVSGLILPTGEMWEAAAGDLRDGEYHDEDALREVAHFRPARATADIRSKRPNKFQLYDMLGNVWEWMANRYRAGNDWRELRGGAWDYSADGVRVAFRNYDLPVYWYYHYGCRFARQDSKKIT